MAIIRDERQPSLAALLGGALGSNQREIGNIRQQERQESSLLEKQKQLEDMKSQRAMQVAAQKHQQDLELQQQKEIQRAKQGSMMAQLLGGGAQQQGSMNPQAQIQQQFNGQPVPQGGQPSQQEVQPQQEQQRSLSFGERDWNDVAREAQEAGLGVKELTELKKIHSSEKDLISKEKRDLREEERKLRGEQRDIKKEERLEKQFEKTQSLKEQQLKTTKNAPRTKKLFDEISEIDRDAENAIELKNDYERLLKISESGQLQSGVGQQILGAIGLGDIFKNPATQMFDKIVVDLNVKKMKGLKGAGEGFLKQISKGDPSSNLSLPAIQNIVKAYGEDMDKKTLLRDEVHRLMELHEKDGEDIPNNTIQEARRNIEPKVKQIDERILNYLSNASNDTFKIKKDKNTSVNPSANVGSLVKKDGNYGIYRGDGQVDQFKKKPVSSDIIEDDPSKYAGKVFPDPETGKQYMSDGKQWFELYF